MHYVCLSSKLHMYLKRPMYDTLFNIIHYTIHYVTYYMNTLIYNTLMWKPAIVCTSQDFFTSKFLEVFHNPCMYLTPKATHTLITVQGEENFHSISKGGRTMQTFCRGQLLGTRTSWFLTALCYCSPRILFALDGTKNCPKPFYWSGHNVWWQNSHLCCDLLLNAVLKF